MQKKLSIRLLKSKEIRNSIVVADIFHDLFQQLHVRRVLPVFYPVSDLVTENPAEILVVREGEEEVEAAGERTHHILRGCNRPAGGSGKLFHVFREIRLLEMNGAVRAVGREKAKSAYRCDK